MMGPFEVTASDLERLGDEAAVDLVRRLVWADAAASGIGLNLVNVPSAINVKDGGVDGEVIGADADSKHGIIKKGITRYQVKSGKFSLSDASIRKILLAKDGAIKDRIKHCLDKNGTLIVAFTKWDIPDAKEEEAVKKFREVLAEVSREYCTAKIEIWHQNTIRGILKKFPALSLHLTAAPHSGYYSVDEWSGHADMKEEVHLGAKQEIFVDDLRDYIRSDEALVHARILGEPGIGKTRLVLEACSAPDIAELVVYVDDPTHLESGDLFVWLVKRGASARVVLVVDECDYKARVNIWNKLRQYSPRIKLITIYNELGEDSSMGTKIAEVPPLSGAEIGRILAEYDISEPERSRWADLCGPYPRAARMIGQSMMLDRNHPFMDSDIVSGWERLITSRLTIGSPEHKSRKAVLLWLSLFKKFGYEGSAREDGEAIRDLVCGFEGMSKGDFQQIVGDLRKMRILQGLHTLYITPKVLHVYLWLEWWRTYGDEEVSEVLDAAGRRAEAGGEGSAPGLESWFYDMFAYTEEPEEVGRAAARLLETGRILGKRGGELQVSWRQASHLPALAKAAPGPVLSHLEGVIAERPVEELLRFKEGRQSIVWSLEHIAKHTGYGARAAGILLALAEAENEEFVVNNATGVLCGMFAPHAPKMSLGAKSELLRSISTSQSMGRKKVGVRACKMAVGPSAAAGHADVPDGAEPPPGPATTAERAEIDRYRLEALDILGMHIEGGGRMADESSSVVLEVARPLLREPALRDKVIGLLEAIRKGGRHGERLAATAAGAVDHEAQRIDEASLGRLRALVRDADAGGDGEVGARLKRYVGMGEGADSREDYDRKQHVRESQIQELARTVSSNGHLGGELGWLVTGEARMGHEFGYALAVHDAGYTMLAAILAAIKSAGSDASGLFAGGYLAHMSKNDPERWDATLGAMYDDDRSRAIFPDLVRISGITDRSISMVLRGIESGRFPCEALGMLQYPNSVSDETFSRCLETLLRRPEEKALAVALRLVYARYAREGRAVPHGLLTAVLLHRGMGRGAFGPMDAWMWKYAALKLIDLHPDDCASVARVAAENVGRSGIFATHTSPPLEVLGHIAKRWPETAWNAISSRIDPPLDRDGLALQSWLRGDPSRRGEGMLSAFPPGIVSKWVAADPDRRAAHVAGILPENFEAIRAFLAEYGNREDVRRALAVNLFSEALSGPKSEHYRAKRQKYAALREGESDPLVLAWLDAFLRQIDGRIDEAVESEMRSF